MKTYFFQVTTLTQRNGKPFESTITKCLPAESEHQARRLILYEMLFNEHQVSEIKRIDKKKALKSFKQHNS
jgi:hypothetical protein